MLSTSQLDLLNAGIKEYVRKLGYNFSRTSVGPNVGETPSGLNRKLEFNGYVNRVEISLGSKSEGIVVSLELFKRDESEPFQVEKYSTNDTGLVKVAKGVKDTVLAKIPQNQEPSTNMTESLFIDNLLQSTRLLVEEEYDRLF
jgi:hypothetical protein